jgi:hypothetical protein
MNVTVKIGNQSVASTRGGSTPPQPVDRRLSSYSLPGLLTLATAAGSSPAVRHRWPSLGHLIWRSLEHPTRGTKGVSPGLLASLLKSARNDLPRIACLEDFLPVDPTLPVFARRDGGLVRLFPGLGDRPVAAVERADLVAAGIDEFLLPKLGFGVRDYVDVGLLYLDHAVRVMGPCWGDAGLTGLDDAPVISAGEYEAARRLVSSALPEAVTANERRTRALRFATSPDPSLPYEILHPDAPQKLTHPDRAADGYLAASLPRVAATSGLRMPVMVGITLPPSPRCCEMLR